MHPISMFLNLAIKTNLLRRPSFVGPEDGLELQCNMSMLISTSNRHDYNQKQNPNLNSMYKLKEIYFKKRERKVGVCTIE